MLTPRQRGILYTVVSRDVYGMAVLSDGTAVMFDIVSLDIGVMKTSVRADSSASRGSADEKAVVVGKVLFPKNVAIRHDDILAFNDARFKIATVHPRYTTGGRIHHFECDLEFYADET